MPWQRSGLEFVSVHRSRRRARGSSMSGPDAGPEAATPETGETFFITRRAPPARTPALAHLFLYSTRPFLAFSNPAFPAPAPSTWPLTLESSLPSGPPLLSPTSLLPSPLLSLSAYLLQGTFPSPKPWFLFPWVCLFSVPLSVFHSPPSCPTGHPTWGLLL